MNKFEEARTRHPGTALALHSGQKPPVMALELADPHEPASSKIAVKSIARAISRWLPVLACVTALSSSRAAEAAPKAKAAHQAEKTTTHESLINRAGARVQVRLDGEVGALLPMAHEIQFGRDGSKIDYVEEGGQANMFPVVRLASELIIDARHRIRLTYQPLELRTTAVPNRELRVDDAVFASGRPIDFRYGFSFYRATYLYDTLRSPRTELSVGLAGQIRNATISFVAVDGSAARTNRDLGFVPLLALRFEHDFCSPLWIGAEAIGFYAPIKYLNGGKSDVEGAIADVSLRVGLRGPKAWSPYFNLRYLGGGASGTEAEPDPGADGYVDNWLHFMTFSIGFRLD